MTIDSYSAIGGRTVNEDSMFADEKNGDCLLIVADGLGGHGGGDVASHAAVDRISAALQIGMLISDDDIIDAVISANDEIIKLCPNSRTTVAVLVKQADTVYAAHVGDSRIYQFRNGKVSFQSRDHSVCQMYVMTGEITQEQIRGHAERNKLLRALGADEEPRIDLTELKIHKGDAFLLCSDGFWENIIESEMLQALDAATDAHEWLDLMRKTLDSRIDDQSDNNTAIAMIYD